MRNMFAKYNTINVENSYCLSTVDLEKNKSQPKTAQKLLTNIKGEAIGVQVTYACPCTLYFHLEDAISVGAEDFETVINGTMLFEILTTTHKVIISKEISTLENMNKYTNDLCIKLSQDEMKKLKRETYTMRLTLKTATIEYPVFAEYDGYLVVR